MEQESTSFMKQMRFLIVLVAVMVLSSTSLNAYNTKRLHEDVQSAIKLLKQTDPTLETFFKKSKGYAVYPNVGKGAIGIGGAHGKGEVFEKGKRTGRSSLSQFTIGFQLGGQSYIEIIFFGTEDALAQFKESSFKLSAQASAVAAADGIGKNAKYDHGVAIFTLAKKGLMFEASVGGQKFKYFPVED